MHTKCEVTVAYIFKWKPFWFFIGYSAPIDRRTDFILHTFMISTYTKRIQVSITFISEIYDHFVKIYIPTTTFK